MQFALSLKFVTSISIPMIIGVIAMILLQYFYFMATFEDWKVFTNEWIDKMEKQRLHNFVYPNKIIAEAQLNNIAFNMRLVKTMKLKIDSGVIQISMRDYDEKHCSQLIYDLQAKNPLYIEQWFHRNISDYNSLSVHEQETLYINIVSNMIVKVIYSIYSNDLFESSFQSNSFEDSMMAVTPSRTSNYKNAAKELCMFGNFLESFDPRCRDWYKNALNSEAISVNVPFLFQSTQVIGVVISAHMTSSEKDPDGFVAGLSVSIENLRNKILAQQDNDDVSSDYEGYSVLFHQANSTIYNHRYWNKTSQQLKSWDQVEYNETATYSLQERESFIGNLTNVISYADNNDFPISSRNIIDSYFISFSRDNVKYLGLVYPVRIAQILDMKKGDTQFARSNFFLGRVHKDIRGFIEQANFNFSKTYKNFNIGETLFTSILVVISLLHYANFLYKAHDIPLQQLILFLNRKDLNTSLSAPITPAVQPCQKQDINVSIINQSAAFQNNQNSNNNNTNTNANTINLFSIPKLNQTQNQISFDYHNPTSNNLNLIQGTTIQSKNFGSGAFDNSDMPTSNVYLKGEKDVKFMKIIKSSNIKNRIYSLNNRHILKQQRSLNEGSTKSKQLQKELSSHQFNNSQKNNIAHISQSNSNALMNSSDNSILEQSKVIQPMELDDIQGIFKEMQVIIDTFKGLENVIRLAQFNQVAGNNATSCIHYSTLKLMVKKINNFNAVGSCYVNLGLLFLKDSKFAEAIEMFQSACSYTLLEMNISSLDEFESGLKMGSLSQKHNSVNLMQKFSKRLRLTAVAMIYSYDTNMNQQSSSILREAHRLLQIAIQIQISTWNSQSELQIKICSTLLAEIYFYEEKYDLAQAEIESLLSSIVNPQDQIQQQDQNVSFPYSFKKIPLHFHHHQDSIENLYKLHGVNEKQSKLNRGITIQTLKSTLAYLMIKFREKILSKEKIIEPIQMLTDNLEMSKYLETFIHQNTLQLLQRILPHEENSFLPDLNLIPEGQKTQNNQHLDLKKDEENQAVYLQNSLSLEIKRELNCYKERSFDLLFLIDTNDLQLLNSNLQQQLFMIQLIGEKFMRANCDTFSIQTYGQISSTICSRIPYVSQSIFIYCLEQLQRELQKSNLFQRSSSSNFAKQTETTDQQTWAQGITDFLESNSKPSPITLKATNKFKQTRYAINISFQKNANESQQSQNSNFEYILSNHSIFEHFCQILNLNISSSSSPNLCSNNNFDENILLLRNQLTSQNSDTLTSSTNQNQNKLLTEKVIKLLSSTNRYFETPSFDSLLHFLLSQRRTPEAINGIYII